MKVKIEITLDVGEQDTTEDGFESAQNQIRSMDLEDFLEIAEYKEIN